MRKYWSALTLPTNVEWVVVDNNSEDDSLDVAERLGARVIASTKNVGFGAANNMGFQTSESEYVAFVNPDVSVDASSFNKLKDAIDRTGGLVAPQLINPDGILQPNGRGLPFLLYKVRGRLSKRDHASYMRLADAHSDRPVPWFMGAAVTGRREVLRTLGPWDERFFVYYEDSDLCLRASKLGVPSTIAGQVRWTHGWARDTKSFNIEAWKRELPSMLKFYTRYPQLLSPWPAKTTRRMARKGWPT